MYSRAEISRTRSAFWTNFGQYMAPVPSADGSLINWVNYKTGVKQLRFTMNFTQHNAEVWVEITFADTDKRRLFFQTFSSLWKEANSGDEWLYFDDTVKEERPMAAIKSSLGGVNIFQQETWPAAISFLKKQMISLDAFWVEYKEMFEMMAG